jgi:hypothetical protein
MPEPKYVENLRGGLDELDRKIDAGDRDLGDKIGAATKELGERLYAVDRGVAEFRSRIDTLIAQADKTGNRQWQLFLAVLGLIVAFLVASSFSIWQVGQHDKQIDKLEKSVDRIVGLEASITRLDASVTKVVGLEKSLADLPALARSIDASVALVTKLTAGLEETGGILDEMRREVVFAGDIRRLNFRLTATTMKTPIRPTQLIFEWELSDRQAYGIERGQSAAAILPSADPVFGNKSILSATEIFARTGRSVVQLNMEFPNAEMNEQARNRLVKQVVEVEILVTVRPKK